MLRFLLSILCASALWAQTAAPQRPQWRGAAQSSRLKAHLELSDQQVQELIQFRRSQFTAIGPTLQELRKKSAALSKALQDGNPDAAALGRMLLEIRATRQQLEQARKNYQEQALARLTPEQKSRLQALDQARSWQRGIREAQSFGLLKGSPYGWRARQYNGGFGAAAGATR